MLGRNKIGHYHFHIIHKHPHIRHYTTYSADKVMLNSQRMETNKKTGSSEYQSTLDHLIQSTDLDYPDGKFYSNVKWRRKRSTENGLNY